MIGFVFGISGLLSVVASLAVAGGAVLLAIWAFKFMSKEDLWKWGWVLLIVGITITFVLAALVHVAMNDTPSFGDVPVPSGNSAWGN